MKETIVAAGKILEGLGLVGGFGHVSARVDKETFIMTPKKSPALVEPDELVLLDNEGNVLSGSPPLEMPLHAAVYRRRGDVAAICRVHAFYASVLAAARIPLKAVHGFGCHVDREVPLYEGLTDLVTTQAQGEGVADCLGNGDAVIIRANGTLVTGNSVEQACVRAVYLEESARMLHQALLVGEPAYLGAEEYSARRMWCLEEQRRAWEYYTSRFGG